ncbi:MAG: hypothetical protein HQK51_11445 [Oligoflexia bacterium]|nr:hypothetical protein [Oligoflexia bacterium]
MNNRPYFIFSMDVEPDDQWNLSNNAFGLKNIDSLLRFKNLTNKHNIKPVYFIEYQVAKRSSFFEIFKNDIINNKCEIGLHMHIWSNPPYSDLCLKKNTRAFQTEIDNELFKEKFLNLKNVIKDKIAVDLISFRAGRWAINFDQLHILETNGIKVDSSITPGIDWSNTFGATNIGGPNYLECPTTPYFLDLSDLRKKGGVPILECPVTIVEKKDIHNFYKLINIIPLSKIKKIANNKVWCRFYPKTKAKLLQSMGDFVNKNNLPYMHFMIHSSELSENTNPLYKTQNDINNLYNKFEQLFSWINKNQMQSITLADFYYKLSSNKGLY